MRDESHLKKMKTSKEISFYDFLETFKYKKCLRAQTFWIKNFNGNIPLDYIGSFENLANDFEKACNMMKIEPLKLPHELKGSANNYHDAYDSKSRDLISKAYREEIQLFGYSFDS